MTFRAYLIDDEPLALDRLRRLLQEAGEIEIVGATTVPEEAIEALSSMDVDVCFLDIQMPRLDGFAVLSALPKQPAVVFTTAYDQYALKAFEVNSVDYLLKPIDRQHLKRALHKIAARKTPTPDIRALVQELAAAMRTKEPEYPERVASRLGDRICFIDLVQVTHFFAEDKLTYAVTNGKKYVVDHSITQLETKLDPRKFWRIHRATLVNASWILDVTALPGGSLDLRLRDQAYTVLTVARDRAHSFRQKLGIQLGRSV